MNSSALSTSSRIHYVIATDMTGRRASYFVQVEPRKEPLFLKAVRGKHIRFDQYGTIVVSCYGEKPTPDAKRLLKERYNYDADFTEAPLH